MYKSDRGTLQNGFRFLALSACTDLSLSGVALHEVVGLELLLLVGDDARHLEHEPRLRGVLLQPGRRGAEGQACGKTAFINGLLIFFSLFIQEGKNFNEVLVPYLYEMFCYVYKIQVITKKKYSKSLP